MNRRRITQGQKVFPFDLEKSQLDSWLYEREQQNRESKVISPDPFDTHGRLLLDDYHQRVTTWRHLDNAQEYL